MKLTKSNNQIWRPLVIGDGSVGRSEMIFQFCEHQFVETFDVLKERCYIKQIILDRKMISIEILDSITPTLQYDYDEYNIKKSDGFIIMYSVTSEESFYYAHSIFESLYYIFDLFPYEHIPIVLCGNKIDLNTQRKVSREDGEKMAKEFKVPFYEISAQYNINVTQCFLAIVDEILKNNTFLELYNENVKRQTKYTNIKTKTIKCVLL
ncbi:hypothetical protein EIN_440870 [Entamoeba invadens IP1]|uniref:Uncharacterized protein n=1 Tax=Entamoeba invadens IP1 TaxID=370355 RepID=A0A0A1TZF2_ENTIV|nr:hypothetical protein EIN_440870 [Entamoeba invadens IP1]ELP83903.1 hypothetical protein EIN_440870 [Entamoeba invadens IP1]|eukprot:XP_004183249.1 hypothetical protein EIN_440870 [Entamoeba invadens IP1]